jgi:phage FluMu protein Com
MTKLKVSLDFVCCSCAQEVGVTVRCEGKGLLSGQTMVATVKVPCPHCGTINRLNFEPDGTVRQVLPCLNLGQLPVPSLN